MGHLISMKLFAVAGVDTRLSWFPENLVPMCRACNNAWIYAEWPASEHGLLWRNRVASWSHFWSLAEQAIVAAHALGIPVWLAPRVATVGGRVGTPVLTVPSDPGALYWRVEACMLRGWRSRLEAAPRARLRPWNDHMPPA